MPTEAEKLTVSSSKQQVREAISSCISQLSRERLGDSQDRIVAI